MQNLNSELAPSSFIETSFKNVRLNDQVSFVYERHLYTGWTVTERNEHYVGLTHSSGQELGGYSSDFPVFYLEHRPPHIFTVGELLTLKSWRGVNMGNIQVMVMSVSDDNIPTVSIPNVSDHVCETKKKFHFLPLEMIEDKEFVFED